MSDPRATRNSHHPPTEQASPALDALAAAFRHAMIGIAIGTPDGRLRDVNPAFARMLGYEREALLELPFSAITHTSDHEGDAEQLRRLRLGAVDAYQREKRYLHRDGSVVWGLVTVSALRDEDGQFLGSSAQVQDITAQKVAEAALRDHEARLESLVDQLPIVLYSQPWGGSRAVRYVSPRFEQETGLRRDELEHRFAAMLERAHPDDRSQMREANDRANRTGETLHLHYRVRGGNGDWRWIDHRSVLMRDDAGQPVAWHGSIIDISERKRLEASLWESEERFRYAFKDAAIGMAIAGPDDTCLDANAAYCAIVGVPREELIGRPIIGVTHPLDQTGSSRRLTRVHGGELESYVVEKRYLRPDGSVVNGLLTISAVRDEAGGLRYCIGQLQDVTAQRATEAALRESEEIVRSVIEQAPAAVYQLAPGADGRFTYASPRFRALTGLSIDDGVTKLSDFFPRVHPDDLARLQAADAEAASTGEPFAIEYRLRGEDGAWVWVHDRSTPARDAAGQIVVWHGVLLDISERKQLQAALLENEARLQSLIEHLPVALYSVDPEPGGPITYASPQYAQLTGVMPEALDRGTCALEERIHPDDLESVQIISRETTASGSLFETEYRVRNADGAWHWVHDRATLVRDSHGTPVAWNGILLDINDRKRLQGALAEREERLRVLVEQLPVAVYSLEPAPGTHYTYVSPRFGALTGMSPAEIARGSEALFARIHPDDVGRVRDADHYSNATGGPHAVEFRVRHDSGDWVWLQERAMLAHDGQGGPLAWHGVLLDISEQRRLQESVRENEARFRSTFEGAAIGMALSTPDCRVIVANPALERLLGYGPGELEGVDSDSLTYPADLAEHARYRERLGAGEIDGYHLEKRYMRKDGEIVWVVQSVTAIRDERGVVQTVIAQIEDITARKAAEEALRESEARFRSTFEGAGIGMSLADMHGRFFDANPAFCRFLGYSRDELLQRTYLDITHPDDRAMSLDYTQRLFRDEVADFTTEKRYLRADGRTVWGDLTITTVSDAGGVPAYEIAQVQDITARKEAEEALRESEARFRSTFEGAGIGMTLADEAGNYIDVNPAFCALLGRSRDELIGQSFLEVTHPEDRAANLAQVTRLQAGEIDAYAIEKRYLHASGRTVWGQLTVTAVRGADGAFSYEIAQIEDITARKEAESALRDSEARFRALVQHDPDVVIIIDDRLQMVYVSPSSLAAFGVPPEALLGSAESGLDRIHSEDEERVLALFGEVGATPGAVASTEARVEHARHGWRWFQVTIANLVDDPGIAGFLINMRDITERKQAELATISALRTQEEAISELERLNQSKSRFLSTISHEFRTPLTAIIGYSELLAAASRSKAVLEDAAVINREARRLNRMVDDVMLLDRVEGRPGEIAGKPLDLNAIAHEVAETFRPLTGKHRLALQLDPALPPVAGDADRLAQALTNLVSNAIKYSPDGGTITIRTAHAADEVTLSVADEGIGIAADDYQRIFERFERIESGIAGRISGTGLGLSIVQDIASAHGGRVWVESEPGHGSRFTLAISAERVGKSAKRRVGKKRRQSSVVSHGS